MLDNEIIDAEIEEDTPFARIFAAHEQLDALFEEPDAVGTSAEALEAMRFQAAILVSELDKATVTDLDEEYEDEENGE